MNRIIPTYSDDKNTNYIIECYLKSPYTSIKHSSYFQTYDDLLSKFKNTELTFVEIGILDGGSLFMWRNYFCPKARIIGIDLNPDAKKWESEGFEIFIGSQEDPKFWDEFFSAVGPVDIILDDGGHSNSQQITTAHHVIPHINDGGYLLVEDVHTSYMMKFGNPSRYSFINYCLKIIEIINSRSSTLPKNNSRFRNIIYSCSFYESIVCFYIDRKKSFDSQPTINNGIKPKARDFRFNKYKVGIEKNNFIKSFIKSTYLIGVRLISLIVYQNSKALLEKISTHKTKKYFIDT